LIRLALENNPIEAVSRERTEAAQQRVRAAKAPGNPVLQITPGLGGSREARDEEIVLSQAVDLFGRRHARSDVANAELRRALAEGRGAKLALIKTVKVAAIGLFSAQEAESLEAAQVEIARSFRDAAARRAEYGDVPAFQVQRAELELMRAENELSLAQAERQVRRAELNQLTGQEPGRPLNVRLDVMNHEPPGAGDAVSPGGRGVGTAPAPGGSKATFNIEVAGINPGNVRKLIPILVAGRPDMEATQASLEARSAQAKALRRQRLPDLSIQARRAPVTDGGGSTALRAVFTIPLFDFGSNKRERRALEAEAREQQLQLKLLYSQAERQIEITGIRWDHQNRVAARFRTGIVPLTLELLRKTQVGYAQGASTYLEVLDAQRTMRQVQSDYLQTLAGVRNAEVEFEAAVGGPFPLNRNGQMDLPKSPAAATVPAAVMAPVAAARPQGGR